MRFEHFEIFDRKYETLTDLEKIAVGNMHSWSAYSTKSFPSKPPTQNSINRINRELNIQLPKMFIELTSIATNYGVWFGSIGNDYKSHNHILNNNRVFRAEDENSRAIPDGFVLINQGFDGHCDCFKIHEWDGSEYPIYYLSIYNNEEPRLKAKTFLEYWKII